MATRTPAERERAIKKNRSSKYKYRLFLGCLISAFVIFLLLRAKYGWFPAPEPEPTAEPVDYRLNYALSIGDGAEPVVSDDAVRLPITDARGEQGIVAVTGKTELVTVSVKLPYIKQSDAPSATPDVFAGVDPVKTEAADESDLLELSEDILHCLAPLFAEADREQLKAKIDASLTKLESEKSTSFIFGVYGISFSLSDKEDMLTVTAAPS